MAITLNTKSYDLDAWQNPNLVYYRGPAADHKTRDEVALGRTPPKANASGPGTARAMIRVAKTVFDTAGNPRGDVIMTTNISYPVGATDAELDAVRDDLGDLLISTAGGAVVNDFDLTH